MHTGDITRISQEIHRKLVEVRRDIHMHPELAYEEFRTTEKLYKYMNNIGINAVISKDGTGVTGLIEGCRPGKTIALRGDIDALPIQEENSFEYKSVEAGKMHACGHDVNLTCVLGAGEVLNRLKSKLKGNVKLIFQPAEESIGGAQRMIESGVLKNPVVDACAAIHAWPDIPVGKVSLNDGYSFAAVDIFKIVVKGKGGHGAIPNLAKDPIVMGSQIVNSFQTLVSRMTDPLIPVVVSVCSFHSGSGTNIIPDQAVLEGTVRTYDVNIRQRLPGWMEGIVKGIVEAYEGGYEFSYRGTYPATLNDKEVTEWLKESAARIIGRENIIPIGPSMSGEDFSFFAKAVPSTYVKLGCSNPFDSQPAV